MMSSYRLDLPPQIDLLRCQLQLYLRAKGQLWAKRHAAAVPGVMYTAIVGDTMYSYEADPDGNLRRVE